MRATMNKAVKAARRKVARAAAVPEDGAGELPRQACVLPDVVEIMRENAALRRENSRLRGEVSVMAMKLRGRGC